VGQLLPKILQALSGRFDRIFEATAMVRALHIPFRKCSGTILNATCFWDPQGDHAACYGDRKSRPNSLNNRCATAVDSFDVINHN